MMISRGWIAVWRRNYLVWKKLAAESVLGNIIEPLFYLVGFGIGFGALVPEVEGVKYIAYLAGGTICYSTMMAASFEALYSGFARMHVQRTWEGILNAPVSLDDVVFAEWVWAASKSFPSGAAVLMVAAALGLAHSWTMVTVAADRGEPAAAHPRHRHWPTVAPGSLAGSNAAALGGACSLRCRRIRNRPQAF